MYPYLQSFEDDDMESDPEFMAGSAKMRTAFEEMMAMYGIPLEQGRPESVSLPRVDVPGDPTQAQQAEYGQAQEYSRRAEKPVDPEAPEGAPLGGVSDRKMKIGKGADMVYALLAGLANSKESKKAKQQRRTPHQISLDGGISSGLGERRAEGEKARAEALAENERRGMTEAGINRKAEEGYLERSSRMVSGMLPSITAAQMRQNAPPTGDLGLYEKFQEDPQGFSDFQRSMHPQQGKAATGDLQTLAYLEQRYPERVPEFLTKLVSQQTGSTPADPQVRFIAQRVAQLRGDGEYGPSVEEALEIARQEAEGVFGPAAGGEDPGMDSGFEGMPGESQSGYGDEAMGQDPASDPVKIRRAKGWRAAVERNPAARETLRQRFIQEEGVDPEFLLMGAE